MGAQVYEREVSRRAGAALDAAGGGWRVEEVVARSLRSPLPGNRRLPVGLAERSGTSTRRVMGRLIYPRGALVHRMDLTLPPSGHEVVTLHDVVAWRFADEGAPVRAAAAELRAAAAVVCVSRATASDAVELFGLDNVRLVTEGVAERFRVARPLDDDGRRALGIPDRYVLHAGGATERKNLRGLADAWRRIGERHPDVALVLAGPPHDTRTTLFRDLPRTVTIGRVDDATLPGLMAGAEAVVVPSLHEGFGLPLLEAMAARTVVVAADSSSLPEVAGGAAILVEPSGVGLAEGLDAVLSGGIDRVDVVARGVARAAEFTWERSAAEHAAIWNEFAP